MAGGTDVPFVLKSHTPNGHALLILIVITK